MNCGPFFEAGLLFERAGGPLQECDNEAGDDFFEKGAAAQITHDELVLAQSKLGQFLDLVPAGLLIHQRQAAIFANTEAAHIFNVPVEDMVGRHFLDFIPDDQYDDVKLVFDKCFDERKTIRGLEVVYSKTDDDIKIIHVSMSPLFWEGLPVINIVFSDISELKKKEALLFTLSITDALTGVYNRRYFLERVESEFSRFQRMHESFTLLSLDIDHFKQINDCYGHAIGDSAIVLFANTISAHLRKTDCLGRMGGEEFSVILPGTNVNGAMVVGENIRLGVQKIRLKTSDGPVSFTVSIGVALVMADDKSIDSLMHRADEALYQAKNAGRNRVSLYQPEPSPP